jgi:AcrR family transcriptional regulator
MTSTAGVLPTTLSLLFPPEHHVGPGALADGSIAPPAAPAPAPAGGATMSVPASDLTSSRTRILDLTMREVARVGPASFSTRTVSEALGLTHPIVNYHFGSKDALIAEAAHLLYARYVRIHLEQLEGAPATPVDRLRTFLRTGLQLSIELRGWGAVLNYLPYYSPALTQVLEQRFADDHRRLYAIHTATLGQVVMDAHDGRVTELPWDSTSVALGTAVAPTLEESQAWAAEHPEGLLLVTEVSFGLHGLGVWRAGHRPPSGSTPEEEAFAAMVTDGYLEHLIAKVSGARAT